MAALYGFLAALALVLASAGRRPLRSRRSIDRYHKAMETLGEISETMHRSGVDEPAKSRAESSSAATSTDSREHSALAVVPRRRPRLDVRSRRSSRFLIAIAVVALAGVVVGVTLSNSGPTKPKHVAAAPPGRGQSTRRSSTTTRTGPTTVPTRRSTTTTTSPASSIKGPVLSSLEPDTGAAGQTLILSGMGITSANGTIVATFDSRPAPTRCPSEQRCLVTVPAGLKGSVNVRLQTESGRSNALTFHYE